MPVPEYLEKFYEMSPTERVIKDVVKNSKGEFIPSQINRVKVVASIQVGIDKYRQGISRMSKRQLETETHDSGRLGEFLDATVMRRPPRCHAHAIVSGAHEDAAELRTLLAIRKLRIDDPHNGCWLPENTAATPHPSFPHAIPHSRIHRYNYYFWLRARLNMVTIKDIGTLQSSLRRIAQHLHENTVPSYVMKPKGQGLTK
ncbi:MAG: AHH domain-containing protein [Methylococcales bacterium]